MKKDKLFEECLAQVPEEVMQDVSDNIDKMLNGDKVELNK